MNEENEDKGGGQLTIGFFRSMGVQVKSGTVNIYHVVRSLVLSLQNLFQLPLGFIHLWSPEKLYWVVKT
jgi:hypothetical protein